MAKPRRLAFRIAPGCTLRRRDCRIQPYFPVQVAQELGDADRLHRWQFGIETAAGEGYRLVKRVCVDHPHKTRIAGGIEPFPRRHQQDRGKPVGA